MTSVEDSSQKNAEDLFKEIKYYLKQWATKIKDNSEIVHFYFHKLLFNLERTAELLFSRLVEFKSETITSLFFELEKWDYYG